MLVGEKTIVTPVKCGSHSVQEMLKPYGYTVKKPRHGMTQCDALLIRHPYDRLVSSWWHACRRRALPLEETFDAYVRRLLVNRKISIWTRTLSEYAGYCKPKHLIRIEHVLDDLKVFGYDVDHCVMNASPNTPRVKLSVGMQEVVYEWCKKDLALGGYQYEDRSL